MRVAAAALSRALGARAESSCKGRCAWGGEGGGKAVLAWDGGARDGVNVTGEGGGGGHNPLLGG